jgi:putative tryptophan/tyrosine transport system substrate-binding protein
VKRRTFILALGGAATSPCFVWPLAAQRKLPTIGFLGSASPLTWKNYVAAFEQRLHELGWLEGKTVTLEYRWAEGRSERFAEISAEFVRLKVDVIVTGGSAALAAKQATSEIPIVFVLGADPLGAGLVKSLSRPGGNVTGLSVQSNDIVGKRLELLREAIPSLRRLAIIANPPPPKPPASWKWFKPRPVLSALSPSGWKSGGRRILRRPSRR